MKYVLQARPDLAATARAVSQRIANAIDGTEYFLKRGIGFVNSLSSGVLLYPRGLVGESLRAWTDSDSGDVSSRRSRSGSYIQRNGGGFVTKVRPRQTSRCALGKPTCTVQRTSSAAVILYML